MSTLIKVVLLQLLWIVIVKYGHLEMYPFSLLGTIFLSIVNFKFFSDGFDGAKYIISLIFFILSGLVLDSLTLEFGLIQTETFPFWMTSLWPLFFCYYSDVFIKFKHMNIFLLSLIGAIGGCFSYMSGISLSALELTSGQEVEYYTFIAIFWSLFFPLSIHLVYRYSLFDWILDNLIYFSFDKTGFSRRKKFFDEDFNNQNLCGRSVLITGGTSGIGLSTAMTLKKLGAQVYVTGRNIEKGRKVERDFGLHFLHLDMQDWDSFEVFCENSCYFDDVVFNAGGMPENYSTNNYLVETQAASQLFGHYYLLRILKKKNKISKESKIVWVSSGGMYLKKLDINELIDNVNYEKVSTYANVKRAQITLVEGLVKTDEWKNYQIYTMHPGWVATPGIKSALPGFYRLTQNRMRTGEEGADSIIWLLLTTTKLKNGGFFFDRREVSPYLFKSYIPSQESQEKLFTELNTKWF